MERGGVTMANQKYRPGENCPKTAKYTEYSSKGKIILEDVNVEEGHRFPPAREKGSYYTEK